MSTAARLVSCVQRSAKMRSANRPKSAPPPHNVLLGSGTAEPRRRNDLAKILGGVYITSCQMEQDEIKDFFSSNIELRSPPSEKKTNQC